MTESIYNITTKTLLFTPRRVAQPLNWVEHFPFAHYLISLLKPSLVVELGTHTGNSFCAFAQATKELNIKCELYAIDSWKGDMHAGGYDDEIYNDLKNYVSFEFNNNIHLKRALFNDAVSDFEDNSIDLLHIDGLHTYDAVKNDFETWKDKVSDKGVILFHDTQVFHSDFGVWKFWKEVKDTKPSYDFSFGHGLGVLLYGEKPNNDIETLFKKMNQNKKTYDDFFMRLGKFYLQNSIIETLKIDNSNLEKSLNDARSLLITLKKTKTYRLGNTILWPFLQLKSLFHA
jgi:hypothetical protein